MEKTSKGKRGRESFVKEERGKKREKVRGKKKKEKVLYGESE